MSNWLEVSDTDPAPSFLDDLGPVPDIPGIGGQVLTGSPDAPDAPDAFWGAGHPEFLGALNAVRAHLAHYVMTSTEDDLDLLTLWIVHTYVAEETYTTPRLLLTSPVPESGKTTVLDHISRLACAPAQMASISSDALLPRMLSEGMRTILIDEADRTLAEDNPKTQQVLAVVNSGYRRGGVRPVNVPDGKGGWTIKEMSTYSPVAMAGNNPKLPGDTLSRTITVILMPAGEGEVAETDWELIEGDVDMLRERIAQAADGVRDYVRANRPPLPAGCFNRRREKWLPLKRIAAAASEEWAGKVDALIGRELDEAQADREAGLGKEPRHITLLRDLSAIYESYSAREFLPTETLLSELQARNPSYWSERNLYEKALTAKALGNMLKDNYGLRSDRLPGRGSQRGYFLASFVRPWRALRIAVPGTGTGSEPVQPAPRYASGASGTPGDPVQNNPGNTGQDSRSAIFGTDSPHRMCLRLTCTDHPEPGQKFCAHHTPHESESPA